MSHDILDTNGSVPRPPTWFMVIASCLITAVGLVPETATAQPQEPLKMTFVDATPNDSGAIHDKLRSVIERSNDIDFTEPSEFLFNAERFDVTLDTLADDSARKEQTELIRRAMRANDLETIVIYKRIDDDLHLILLGPSGTQLEHYRSPIRQPTINDEQAIAVLKRIFDVVVSKVQTFREQNPNAQQANPQPQSDQSEPSDDDSSSNNTSADAGEWLGSQLTVSLAPVFALRTLVMDTADTNAILTHSTPIFGGGADIDAIFGIVDASNAALGATAFLEFAPFRTRFPAIDATPRGTYFRSGARLRYYAALSSTITLFGQVGGESLNIGLTSNQIYVGSTYFALSGGAGATIRLTDSIDATVEADLMPTLLSNTNDGAFGPGGFSLGFSGGAKLRYRGLDPWMLSASYDFLMYSPDHPRPTLDAYAAPASGTDLLHVGGISAGYTF